MIRKDILNREWDFDCIGCAMAEGKISPPGGIIKSSEYFQLHQDPEIPIQGFLVITSNRHIQSMDEMSIEEVEDLFKLIYFARLSIKKLGNVKEITIIQEERANHFHLWLFPRHEWMNEQFNNSLSSIREIMNFARTNNRNTDNIDSILRSVATLKDLFSKS